MRSNGKREGEGGRGRGGGRCDDAEGGGRDGNGEQRGGGGTEGCARLES